MLPLKTDLFLFNHCLSIYLEICLCHGVKIRPRTTLLETMPINVQSAVSDSAFNSGDINTKLSYSGK